MVVENGQNIFLTLACSGWFFWAFAAEHSRDRVPWYPLWHSWLINCWISTFAKYGRSQLTWKQISHVLEKKHWNQYSLPNHCQQPWQLSTISSSLFDKRVLLQIHHTLPYASQPSKHNQDKIHHQTVATCLMDSGYLLNDSHFPCLPYFIHTCIDFP